MLFLPPRKISDQRNRKQSERHDQVLGTEAFLKIHRPDIRGIIPPRKRVGRRGDQIQRIRPRRLHNQADRKHADRNGAVNDQIFLRRTDQRKQIKRDKRRRRIMQERRANPENQNGNNLLLLHKAVSEQKKRRRHALTDKAQRVIEKRQAKINDHRKPDVIAVFPDRPRDRR